MTQPIAPGLPVESSAEIPMGAPVPAPGLPAGPPPLNWVQQRQAEMAAKAQQREEASRAAEQDATVAQAKQEALRTEHGALESGASAFFRGGLDALLTPGAGLAVGLETVGNLYQVKALEDFGRGLGKASTGKSAMEALAFVLGGGGQEGAELADASNRVLREQQEARPTLTTVSRLAGLAAVGLGIGGAASHAKAATLAAVNVLEGAASGAQTAYDESAPLRDVLVSAGIGAAIGGVVSGAAEGVQYGLKKAPDLSKVFGRVQKQADKLALGQVVGKDSEVWNRVTADPELLGRVARELRVEDVVGSSPSKMAALIEGKAAKYTADEIALARELHATLGESSAKIVDGLDGMVARKLAGVTGDEVKVGRDLAEQIAPWKERLAIKQMGDAGPVTIGYRNPTFEDLVDLRAGLRPLSELGAGPTNATGKAYREMFDMVTRHIDNAADAAGPAKAAMWKEIAQGADDFSMLHDALLRGAAKQGGKPLLGGSALGSGIAGAIFGAVTAANPLAYLGYAAAGAIGHKAINTVGKAALSGLMNRFAKMGTRVSLRTAGGREMQEVMTALAKTKQFAADMAESAGANPLARQEAEELAKDIAVSQLTKRAGPIAIEQWADKPLSPLQKVFYRGQLLDKVSQDLSTVASQTASLFPSLPGFLDAARVAKLAKDADGPAAIGALQNKVREIASSVPPTPTGEAAAVALRKAAGELERADVGQAMSRAHELAGWLDESAGGALDEPTRQFVTNAAKAVRAEMTGEAFGEAGRQYQALLSRPETLENMAKADKVRQALVGLEGHGMLPAAIRQAQDQVATAWDAAAKLAGAVRPKTLAKDFEAGEHIFHAAEEALTLDGKAMHHIFEVSQHAGIHEAASPHAEAGEMTVADAVDEHLDHLTPVLKDAATGGSPRTYRPDLAGSSVAPKLPPTIEEQRQQYGARLKQAAEWQTSMLGTEDGQHPMIASGMNDKMAQLLKDMPKPPSTPLGTAGPDALSADDLRLANAMWEATTEPLSVFQDLASGYIDPDKSAYAWKQYPGLKAACQAGIVDCLGNDLTQEEREALPENLLTQLDATFGFGGRLQETSDPFFAARMSEMYRTPQEKRPPPQPNGVLKLPGAEPSFVERIANG